MIVIINIFGLLLIAFIIWWFWLAKTKAIKIKDKGIIAVKVKDGVYKPAKIEIPANQPIILEFIREDSSGCSEYLIFPELKINRQLPLNKPALVELGNLKPEIYKFSCQMQMYVGELVVKN